MIFAFQPVYNACLNTKGPAVIAAGVGNPPAPGLERVQDRGQVPAGSCRKA